MYDSNYLCHFGILGMRWGVRRYENKDGTLTAAGKRRYDYDKAQNDMRKPKNRMNEKALKNPNRWVEEDMAAKKGAFDAAEQLTRKAIDLEKNIRTTKSQKIDLSEMSDQELRDKINRALLERQYRELMGPKIGPSKAEKGKKIAKEALSVAGSLLGVGSSSINLAMNIRKLQKSG